MPAAIPVPIRQAILQRAQNGQSASEIARALAVNVRTVRHLLQRLLQGPEALAPSYHSGCSTPQGPLQDVYNDLLTLRRQHPPWGAGFLRIVLLKTHAADTVPCERTLQRWLHQAGLGPAPAGRRPRTATPRAGQPHDVWQVDAAEFVRLQSGQQVSWFRIADECSGAVLWTTVFPPRAVADRPGRPGAAGLPTSLHAVGAAGHDPGGQRRSLGF